MKDSTASIEMPFIFLAIVTSIGLLSALLSELTLLNFVFSASPCPHCCPTSRRRCRCWRRCRCGCPIHQPCPLLALQAPKAHASHWLPLPVPADMVPPLPAEVMPPPVSPSPPPLPPPTSTPASSSPPPPIFSPPPPGKLQDDVPLLFDTA